MSGVWAIVVAGGSGTRFGDTMPKQFLDLGGLRVLDWALAAASAACDGVVAVLPAAHLDAVLTPGITKVAGGATRSASVRAGLAAVPDGVAVIVVHDAARPLATPELFQRVIAAVRTGADGAVPGVPVADTIKSIDPTGGQVIKTLDRAALRAVQTPQAFSPAALLAAHARGADATDDAALVERLGAAVHVIDGETANLKVTTARDLALVRALAGLESQAI